jgi:hypothetical protein
MKLYIFKPREFDPLIFIIVKISDNDTLQLLESMTSDIFQILFENDIAKDNNILVFSIIKDHTKSTINMILPSINSNMLLTNRLYENTQYANTLVVQTLKNTSSQYTLDFTNMEDIVMMQEEIRLDSICDYYTV